MFATNIKDNLTFYNPNASQKIDAALKATDLDNFVAIKDGLNTKIGEMDVAFLVVKTAELPWHAHFSKDQILFFDEPTAHLDIETEYELKQPMKN